MIRLRFVAGCDSISLAIILRSQICMPFTPSHVECVMPDGKYAGQHFQGGMVEREVGYDKSYLSRELILDLPSTPDQAQAFYDYVRGQLGKPYDWRAILDYALPINGHAADHAICSAVMTLALRKAQWLAWPLTVPAHLISPRDLLLLLSGLVEIPH